MFSNDIFVQVEKQIDDWLRKMMSYLNAGNLASIDEVPCTECNSALAFQRNSTFLMIFRVEIRKKFNKVVFFT